MQDLERDLQAMVGRKILILGDMVADIYVDGRISRISREAPVLVLKQAGETVVAGGAANVVHNVETLGGEAYAVGILGDDRAGIGLRAILEEKGVDTRGLCVDESRPTITKTRIIAGGRATVSQQIVRIDNESEAPLCAEVEEELLAKVEELLPQMEGVVLSDYGTGTVTERLRQRILGYCREKGLVSLVDSRYDVASFRGVGYVKQNDAELSAALGRELPDTEAIASGARELREKLQADGVLVTRGEKGMLLVLADGSADAIPVADKSEVFDVSGAGDTCVATMALALAGGVAPGRAARLSNIASGIAVRKLGTAIVSHEELRAAAERGGEVACS